MSLRKRRRLNIRVTDNEMKYLDSIARARNINLSEATRWVIHQSLLLSLLERDEIKSARQKLIDQIENFICYFEELLLGAWNSRVIMFQRSKDAIVAELIL